MRVHLITVGDELLDGRVIDAHTTTIARVLSECGLSVARSTSLGDDLAALKQAFIKTSDTADLCVVTGGLGPTPDDLTVEALGAAVERPLVEHSETWARIQARYAPEVPPTTNRKQALLPEGAEALSSDVGTAPGVRMTLGDCTFYLFPGVPSELSWHLETHLRPALPARPGLHRVCLRFAGVGESALAEGVEALELPTEVSLSWLTRPGLNEIHLSGAEGAVNQASDLIKARWPEALLPEGAQSLAEAVLEICRARGLTVGTAESCTGGLVGGALTAIPGSSDVVMGGIIAYANAVKMGVLGVSEEILTTEGAVSEACAAAMAEGARAALGCDLAVSITGIAGPGGGTPSKPVGTVCFGWASQDTVETVTLHLRGDRDGVRRRSIEAALNGLRRRATR